MRVSQLVLTHACSEADALRPLAAIQPQLVLAFGSVDILKASSAVLRQVFSQAHLAGCSTAGEISRHGVRDESLVLTAVAFAHCEVRQGRTTLAGMQDSFAAGQRLAQTLPSEGLRGVLLLGQGVQINGSALLEGLTQVLGPQVLVTGGLAGDGANFKETWVLDDGGVSHDRMVCLGFYGQALRLSHGSFGGWFTFGPARKVTHCEGNILYALDGESALEVYKRYLGDHASALPASGLLFPFAMLGKDHGALGLIRTILGVDESRGSLTLAGDIDPDGYLKLMHASTDDLVDGAVAAAQAALLSASLAPDSLAVLVSCVGRKLVMGGRVDEEVEAVTDVLGAHPTPCGFYSYGEISPFNDATVCKLHNQTMAITCFSEVV